MPGDLDHVFFTSGGSESVESAWKLVRQYHVANGEPQRTKAIARDRAYHGVTLGALSFTGVPNYKEQFGPPAIPVTHVANTNPFRGPADGEDEAAFCARLLAEIEGVVQAEGPDTIAMIIMEPVQNAGGCLDPARRLLAGPARDRRPPRDPARLRRGHLRLRAPRASGSASSASASTPDLATTAKGLTSAYAPMGAVMVSDRVAAPLYDDETRTLMHGITFAGHPLCAAIALRNLEVFQRDGILENVRAHEPHLAGAHGRAALAADRRRRPRRGLLLGASSSSKDDDDTRLDADERERVLRGFLPGRLLEAGLIARPDDRGDAVLHVAPPLISDTAVIDEMAAKMGEVLTDADDVLHGRRTA